MSYDHSEAVVEKTRLTVLEGLGFSKFSCDWRKMTCPSMIRLANGERVLPTFCFCSLEIELCIRGNRNIAKGESVHARITRIYIVRSSIGGIEGLTV